MDFQELPNIQYMSDGAYVSSDLYNGSSANFPYTGAEVYPQHTSTTQPYCSPFQRAKQDQPSNMAMKNTSSYQGGYGLTKCMYPGMADGQTPGNYVNSGSYNASYGRGDPYTNSDVYGQGNSYTKSDSYGVENLYTNSDSYAQDNSYTKSDSYAQENSYTKSYTEDKVYSNSGKYCQSAVYRSRMSDSSSDTTYPKSHAYKSQTPVTTTRNGKTAHQEPMAEQVETDTNIYPTSPTSEQYPGEYPTYTSDTPVYKGSEIYADKAICSADRPYTSSDVYQTSAVLTHHDGSGIVGNGYMDSNTAYQTKHTGDGTQHIPSENYMRSPIAEQSLSDNNYPTSGERATPYMTAEAYQSGGKQSRERPYTRSDIYNGYTEGKR